MTVEQSPSGGESTTGSGAAAPAAGPVLAEAPVTVDQVPSRFVITELRRSGATVILNARVEPVGDSDGSGQITDLFSDSLDAEDSEEAADDRDSFDGAALIDGDARRKYLVARDPAGGCVCTAGLSSAFVDNGSVNLEATLTAPPPNVQRVDVVIPRVRTFPGVPISG